MEAEKVANNQQKKVEELHWEIQQWKSQFQFIDDELVFIMRLLDSNAFQPKPNLFENLQGYKANTETLTTFKKELRNAISIHESHLGSMMECTDIDCDENHYREHHRLVAKIDAFSSDFKNLKTAIFNYTGSILKKSKLQSGSS